MIVVFALVVAFVVALVLYRFAVRRRNARASVAPLAGVDTGFRSAFGSSRSFFNHRRGF